MKAEPLHSLTRTLAAVALGHKSAELVIRGVNLVNVYTAEILPNIDVAVTHGRIALVGDAAHCIGSGTKVIDGTGKYLAPGFMDGHIHVESSMMTVRNYAKAVIPHGTTTIFSDPHEIANVIGPDGVKLMLDDSEGCPLRNFITMPSCVPAVAAFEDTGGVIEPADVERFMAYENVCGLGEVMNYPGVVLGDAKMHDEIAATLRANKTVTGHFSVPDTGAWLNAYIASGAACCHESTQHESALEKLRRGMGVQIREGSAWHDLKEVIRCVTEHNIDTRLVTLVSDDAHPETLLSQGHLDHIVRRAIEEGVPPITAIQMVTINAATLFGMERDYGGIAPGKCADMVLLDDLERVKVNSVFIGGVQCSENGKLTVEIPAGNWPAYALDTVKVPKLTAADFAVKAPENAGDRVKVRVMEVIPAHVGIHALTAELPVANGEVLLDGDIARVAVIDRYTGKGTMGRGFVKGFRLNAGAVASTVAHDAHNLMVVGLDMDDMAAACNALIDSHGGMAAVRDGEVLAINPLPLAGIMSLDEADVIAERVSALDRAWKSLGCDIVSPFMTMALIPLAVLPELRLTNRGLIDTVKFEPVSLFV